MSAPSEMDVRFVAAQNLAVAEMTNHRYSGSSCGKHVDMRDIRSGREREALRGMFLRVPLIRSWYDRGYFNHDVRRQRFANYVFKVMFRVNADCPWSVHFTSCVVAPERIEIGVGVERSFMFSGGCYVQGGNGIQIGDGTVFGPGVKIVSANHDRQYLDRWVTDRPIRIGRRCWIGANAVILPGVELADDVTVGAGAVVTRSFPEHAIVGGSPARILRQQTGTDEARDE